LALKFQQTSNTTAKKIVLQKFEIHILKKQNFLLSSFIKMNSKQLFTKKLYAKEEAKIKLLKLLLIQGYFHGVLTLSGGTFLQFSQMFCSLNKILYS